MPLPLAQDRSALQGLSRAALAGLALAAAAGAAAQEPLDARGFAAIAEGRTLHFTHLGLPYGAEQFFPGRRSLWRTADGICAEGRWWAEGEAICFRYEAQPVPQCWRFLPGPAGLAAEHLEAGAGTGFVVELSHADTTPLPCPGPKVGS
jgi:hypothetical protein